MDNKVKFILPPENFFTPNDPIDDPLSYYYRPIVGLLYRQRIQNGLNLLEASYDSVLEFGYGSGLLLPTLGSACKNLSAIDIVSEPEKIKLSLDRMGLVVDLKKGDITKVAYPSDSFDLIVGFSVFEHISNSEPILEEMHRILKSRGQLLVGMPRVDGLMEKFFKFIGYKDINEHHVMSFEKFLDMANKYFSVKKQSRMPSFLPALFGLYFTVLLEKK
ncbi:class I SAM-dependent methyltransferase [Patescibacteria group bacterium]|nr:class I SAM-dependent methyltransferase [Patescibacteria group bacterium]